MMLPSLRANDSRLVSVAAGQWAQAYDRLGQKTGAYVLVWAVAVAGVAPRQATYQMALSAGEITYPPTGGQPGLRAWDVGYLVGPGGAGALINGPAERFYVPPEHTLHLGASALQDWRFTIVVEALGVLPAVQPLK